MLNLKAGDIEWDDERTYYSYRGKGGKNGRRELPRPAFEAIQRTLADCGRTLATMARRSRSGGRLRSPRSSSQPVVYARFRKYLVAAGLPKSGFHVLRHSAAKLRRDVGESVEQVSQFLDHSSLAVTSVYLRRLEVVEDRGWVKVAEAMGE